LQQFSDDDEELDVPLAPLPDEMEVVEGDEDDQDEGGPLAERGSVQEVPDTTALNTEALPTPAQPLSPNPRSPRSPPPDAQSPNPHTLSFQPGHGQATLEEAHDALDAALKPLDTGMDSMVDVVGQIDSEGVNVDVNELNIDMSNLGPDGLPMESSVHELSQVDAGDALLGGPIMDNTLDPFAGQQLTDMHDPPE
jgi:hypothetical protein